MKCMTVCVHNRILIKWSDRSFNVINLCRLRRLVEEGIHGLSNFFHSLDDLFVGKEPPLHKTSLFGEYICNPIDGN